MKQTNGILFPKGSKSKCISSIEYGNNGQFRAGRIYDHPEDNCIIDDNFKEFFIPQNLIKCFLNLREVVNLPTEPYSVSWYARSFSGNITFKIQPLSAESIEMVQYIKDMGASVRLMPEKDPTSLIISYEKRVSPITKPNGHQVVGAKLDLHIFLIDNDIHGSHNRISTFLSHMKELEKGELPDGANSVEWVQVLSGYKL